MYGYLLQGCVEFDLVVRAIFVDDVDAIHRQFQERRCGPLDWLVWDDDDKTSLLQVSRSRTQRVHLPINCGSEETAAVC